MSDTLSKISRHIAEYTRCIDSDHLEEWPEFFMDDCLYCITTAKNYEQGLPAGIIFANSKGMLQDRVSALREANIYEQHRYRHILGQPIMLAESDINVRTETPFLVARIMRDGQTDLYATGRYLDLFQIRNGLLQLKERHVVCDSERIDTLLALPL